MAVQYKIVQDQGRAARGLPSYTFLIDGRPSLAWCANERAVQRKIDRLRAGRSDVFGGPVLMVDGKPVARVGGQKIRAKIVPSEGEVTTEMVTTKSGKQKPREKRPGFDYELDGRRYPVKVSSESEARELAAVHGFLTRGKVGRAMDAAKLVGERFGAKGCRVFLCARRHKLMVRDESGAEYVIGVGVDGGLLAKPTGAKAQDVDQVPLE